MTGNGRNIAVEDPRLADKVADNNHKWDITESLSLLFGRDFGVGTDIETGPNAISSSSRWTTARSTRSPTSDASVRSDESGGPLRRASRLKWDGSQLRAAWRDR